MHIPKSRRWVSVDLNGLQWREDFARELVREDIRDRRLYRRLVVLLAVVNAALAVLAVAGVVDAQHLIYGAAPSLAALAGAIVQHVREQAKHRGRLEDVPLEPAAQVEAKDARVLVRGVAGADR